MGRRVRRRSEEDRWLVDWLALCSLSSLNHDANFTRLPVMKRSAPIFAILLACYSAVSPARAAGDDAFFVEGYANPLSAAPGQEVAFHVSCTASSFGIEILRWGGTEPHVVWSKKNVPGQRHPVPDDASSQGCRWPATLRVPVGNDWQSGYYTARFHIEDKGGPWSGRSTRSATSEAPFVVRPAEPGKKSRILLQLATNTYNAYTNWGGFSLYAYHGLGKNQGHRVSFDRPLSSQFSRWELPFVQWCEKQGIALDYAANGDLEEIPDLLKPYRLVLSVGHDEYWSGPMRDAVETHIREGGNAAFFSGNSVCWQVRSEDGGRALTCYKQNYHTDPVYQTRDFSTLSTAWSHHLLGRPENQLTGVGFLWGGYHRSHGQFMDGKASYTVHRPEHWVFEGTNLRIGEEFGGKDTIVGYETDGCELEWREGIPYPTHRDGTPETFTVLGTCPASWHPDDAEWYEKWQKGRIGAACMGVWTSAQGGTVFTAATTDWAHGLAGGDPAVEKITRNVLEKLGH